MGKDETVKTPLVQQIEEEDLQSIVEKYDIESRFRRPVGFPKMFVSAWLIAMSLFHLYTAGI
ncbi:MAG TPA: hypothetical protein PKY02_05755, partial [Synergistales bacterium]|nr:hypothetical protein [Synergistales bacterium]